MRAKKLIHLAVVYWLIAVFTNCKEKYVLPNVGPPGGYLVVEGVINSGQGPTNIRLSRTLGLVDSVRFNPELHAQVWVEGKDNSKQPLNEKSNGIYNADQLSINVAQEYRLYIKTTAGKEYYSGYEKVLKTPVIDTINWGRRNGGVEIFVNTHDVQNKIKYYRWEFEETWEFHSKYFSQLKYVRNPATNKIVDVESRPYDEQIKMYYCWKDENSTEILIGSSESLSRDTIHLPIRFIPRANWKLSVLYSIKVRQNAIGAGEYDFLRRMKKNTEQVGSLFDAQPSELVGNIQCASNPAELVMGYVGVADIQEKRIFIRKDEVPDWGFFEYCDEKRIPNIPDTLEFYSHAIPTIPLEYSGPRVTALNVTEVATCADCTLRGTNVKPSFWP